MEFIAQYPPGVFAVLGLLLLARLRTEGFRRAVRDALWAGGAVVLSYALGRCGGAPPTRRPTGSTTRPVS